MIVIQLDNNRHNLVTKALILSIIILSLDSMSQWIALIKKTTKPF